MDFIRANQTNIMLILASICIIILVFILMTNYLSKEKKKALLLFMFFTAFLLLSDRYAYIYREKASPDTFILARLFKFLVFFNILNVVYGFDEFIKCIYMENHPDSKPPKIFNLIKLIILTGHIFLIISQFTNLYYSFDSNNIYHREKMYVLCYLFPIVATLLQYIVIAPEIKKTSRRFFIPLVLYFTLPILASILQLFNPGLSLSNIIIGSVSIILYSVTIYDANIMQEEKKKTEADLKLASEIQQNEIPNEFPAFPEHNEFDLYAMMSPAKDVGGDFYDYFLLDDDHLGIAIADVSGKGIPAALNMIKVKVLLKNTALKLNDPAKILELLNDSFIDNNKLDMFVTLWFGIINTKTGKLIYANAGHEDLIICKDNIGYELLKTKHDIPIGAINNTKYQNHEITLNKGDKFFVFTDGVTEAIDYNNKSFGIDNLLKSLNIHKNQNVENTIKRVKEDITKFTKSNNQFDDITMLCFELKNNENEIHFNKKFKAELKEINTVYKFFNNSLNNIFNEEKIKKYYIVLDEIFSNIVKYGYKDNKEKYITIDILVNTNTKKIIVTFEDNGIKFNPLEKQDPNIKLSAKDRKEGGLGIYIVKNMVDKVSYKYKNNKNYLILEKKY